MLLSKYNRAAGELEGQRSGGAGVNDMPAACQSRAPDIRRTQSPIR